MHVWKSTTAGEEIRESSQFQKAGNHWNYPIHNVARATINWNCKFWKFMEKIHHTWNRAQRTYRLPSKPQEMLETSTKQPIQKHLDDNKRINKNQQTGQEKKHVMTTQHSIHSNMEIRLVDKNEWTPRGGHAVTATSHSTWGDIFSNETGKVAFNTGLQACFQPTSSLNISGSSWRDLRQAGGRLKETRCNKKPKARQAATPRKICEVIMPQAEILLPKTTKKRGIQDKNLLPWEHRYNYKILE